MFAGASYTNLVKISMKAPQPAPDWKQILPSIPADFSTLLARPEVRQALHQAASSRYPYWDDLKYLPLPHDVKPEWIWAWREFASVMHRRYVPLKTVGDKPFSFWIPDSAQQLLHMITQRSAGPLLSDGQPFHSRERYIARSLSEEAIASSQIEGAATTRESARELLRTGRKPADKSERMIVNNFRAMERLRELRDRPLSRQFLLEIQAILTEGTLDDASAAGRFRRSPQDDDIVVEDVAGAVLHRPPSGATLERSIDDMIAFANDGEGAFLHPVVKAILLHFWIAYAHPFVDGNGRTARAFFYWFALKEGFGLFEFISISHIVYRSYSQYLRAFLYSEAEGADATYFIMYNLRVIDLALQETLRYIERKGAELQRANQLIRTVPDLNYRQRQLLVDAVKNPGQQYSIKGHQNTHQITYQTARTDLLGLVRMGYLEQYKNGKLFLFLPTGKIAAAFGLNS